MTRPILSPSADFSPQTVDKVERLLELLAEIGGHRYLGPRLVLHGGTALNVFHLDLPRLSVDIDLLYVGSLSPTTMLAERSEVRTELETMARKLGYRHNRPRDEHAGVTYKLTYRAVGGADQLKVDLNFLNRLPLLGHQPRLCQHCAPGVTFNVVPYPELIAGKVKALAERRVAAMRDLYDVYGAAMTPVQDRDLLQALVLYYWSLADTFPRDFDGSVAARFKAQQRALESELFPVLPPSERPNLSEMISVVSAFLQSLGGVTPPQREYLQLMAASGDYRPELLFGTWPEVLARAQSSPAAAWKVQNLQRRAQLRQA